MNLYFEFGFSWKIYWASLYGLHRLHSAEDLLFNWADSKNSDPCNRERQIYFALFGVFSGRLHSHQRNKAIIFMPMLINFPFFSVVLMHQNCIIGANRISASNLFASFVSCIPRKNTSIPLRFIILMYFVRTTWQFRWNEFRSTQSFANLHCLMGAFLFFCLVCKWIDNCGAVGDDDDDGTLSHYGRNSTSHFFRQLFQVFFECAFVEKSLEKPNVLFWLHYRSFSLSFGRSFSFEIREWRLRFKWMPSHIFGGGSGGGNKKVSMESIVWTSHSSLSRSLLTKKWFVFKRKRGTTTMWSQWKKFWSCWCGCFCYCYFS